MNMQATLQTTEINGSSSKKGKPAIAAPKVLLTETSRLPYVALFALDLARSGCDVSFVCPSRHPAVKTDAIRQMFPYSALRPLDFLTAAIEAVNPDFIIPCDDRAVKHLHELHARAARMGTPGRNLAALIEKSLGSPKSYPVVSSRYDLLRIAREEGIRLPDTQQISSESDLKSWQAQHPFPWVLKADGTYGGYGVRIVHTLEQAQRFYTEFARFYGFGRAIKRLCVNRDGFWLRPWWQGVKPRMIVQSFIHGQPANSAVMCWKGNVLGGVGVDVVSAVGQTAPASVVRIVDNSEMKLCEERIARRLNLSGFFGFDFMVEEGSGLTYLIEMNPRPTRASRLQLGKGRDLIGAFCAQISGRPARQLPPVTENKMIAYFPDASGLKREFLDQCYHDKPEDAGPGLAQELRQPWPTGTLLWRLADQMDYLRQSVRRRVFSHEPIDPGNQPPHS